MGVLGGEDGMTCEGKSSGKRDWWVTGLADRTEAVHLMVSRPI